MKIVAGPQQTAGVYGAYLGAIITIVAFFVLSDGEFKGLTILAPVFAVVLAAFFGALCANAGVLVKSIKLGAVLGAVLLLLPFVVQALAMFFWELGTLHFRMLIVAFIATMIGMTAGAVGGWVGRKSSTN